MARGERRGRSEAESDAEKGDTMRFGSSPDKLLAWLSMRWGEGERPSGRIKLRETAIIMRCIQKGETRRIWVPRLGEKWAILRPRTATEDGTNKRPSDGNLLDIGRLLSHHGAHEEILLFPRFVFGGSAVLPPRAPLLGADPDSTQRKRTSMRDQLCAVGGACGGSPGSETSGWDSRFYWQD